MKGREKDHTHTHTHTHDEHQTKQTQGEHKARPKQTEHSRTKDRGNPETGAGTADLLTPVRRPTKRNATQPPDITKMHALALLSSC